MKLSCTLWPLLLLGACYASAQQSTPVGASAQLETVMYARLNAQSLVQAAGTVATQRWSELAAANSSLRSRLAAPLSIAPAFDVPALQSGWLSNNPNDPVRQLARIVMLRYPSVVDASLMHARLRAMPEFEVVYNARRQYKLAAIGAEPYVDPPAPSANALWCNTASPSTCLASNPFAAVGFVPAIGTPPNDLKQTESYGQWGITKIGAPNAWEKLGADRFDSNPSAGLYGSTNVAVIDFGIARGCDPFYVGASNCNGAPKYHPDLDANVRDGLSIGHAPGSNGGEADDVEESGLEFLDPAYSHTFLQATPARFEGNVVRPFSPALPANSFLSSGHGSHVSGIIAARLNGLQGAGVCPSCSLAMYRSNNSDAYTRMLLLAQRNGAQAINMSWETQVTFPGAETNEEKNAPSPLDALLNVGGARDIWMVASAGNFRGESNPGQPASNVNVVSAGGSDLLDNFWDETKLGRPVCVGVNVPEGCCPTSGPANECGSSYPFEGSRFLIAPAARVLSTLYTIWNSSRFPTGLAACTPELFPDAANPSALVFNANYGVCTGTSMSAPFITGAGAVLRSANPLLSVQNMLTALQSTGSTISNVPLIGAGKRINVDMALNQAYGSIGASSVENRVIPLFAARSVRRLVRNNVPATPVEEAATDWLMSAKPQMLIQGGMGDLYFYRNYVVLSQTNPEILPQAGARGNVYYDSPINLPTLAGYTSYPGTSNVAPRASAFIFATQRTPYNGAPDNLVPLYRLAMQGFCRGKKHVYSSGLIASGAFTVGNLTTVGQKCSPTTNNSADPAVLDARFNLVSIEGFLFANAQPGTVPLKLKYSSAEQSYAVMTPADESRAEFAGYSNPASGEVILGYAYSNDTQAGNGLDNDTWPSGWELARGMNELTTDGDCDGLSDDAEYSLAGFPVSDPMGQALNCADMRIKKTVAGNLATYTVTNPVGPVAASAVRVEVDYVISTLDPTLVPGPLTTPSGWSCSTATYGMPLNSYGVTKACTTAGNFPSAGTAVFTVSGGGNKVAASEVRVLTTSTDPVGVNNTVN